MKIKNLMARLSELDPEDDIFVWNRETGDPEPVRDLEKNLHHIESAGGRTLPKMVWTIMP